MTLADSIRSRVVRLLAEFGLEALDPEAIVASEIEELQRYVTVLARSKGEQSAVLARERSGDGWPLLSIAELATKLGRPISIRDVGRVILDARPRNIVALAQLTRDQIALLEQEPSRLEEVLGNYWSVMSELLPTGVLLAEGFVEAPSAELAPLARDLAKLFSALPTTPSTSDAAIGSSQSGDDLAYPTIGEALYPDDPEDMASKLDAVTGEYAPFAREIAIALRASDPRARPRARECTTDRSIMGELWPADVSAEDLAQALDAVKGKFAFLACEIAAAVRVDMFRARLHYAKSDLVPDRAAFIVSVLKDIREGLACRMIALDAGQPHHALLSSVARGSAAQNISLARETEGTWALRFPEPAGASKDPKLQLTLFDTSGESPSETLLAGIKQWRSAFGLRNWVALQKLLSDAGRSGKVFWRVRDHLDALGVSKSWRSRSDNVAKVVDEIRALASIELVYEHANKEHRLRGRIIQPGPEYDIKRGAAWELEGIELSIHPSLYSGVRARDGSIGRDFWPLPPELATIDHERFGPALTLGPVLAIRFRWATTGQPDIPELRIGVAKLLEMGGIDPAREGRGHQSRVLKTLDANLRELVRVGVLGSATWETPGDVRSIVLLRPSHRSVDRAVRGLLPTADPHPQLIEALPMTGRELAVWRQSRGLTQAALADALGVARRTIIRAEADATKQLLRKLVEALRHCFGTR